MHYMLKRVTVLTPKELLQEEIRYRWLEKIHCFRALSATLPITSLTVRLAQNLFCVNKNELKEKILIQ
jgi:hypothetical protein